MRAGGLGRHGAAWQVGPGRNRRPRGAAQRALRPGRGEPPAEDYPPLWRLPSPADSPGEWLRMLREA
eukprot:6193451-Lingulodinium_polyedra.AAC.1